jgi:hypothetical protein
MDLADPSFETDAQEFLRFYGKFHGQLLEDLFAETIDDHGDGILSRDPALVAVKELRFANPRGRRFMLYL